MAPPDLPARNRRRVVVVCLLLAAGVAFWWWQRPGEDSQIASAVAHEPMAAGASSGTHAGVAVGADAASQPPGHAEDAAPPARASAALPEGSAYSAAASPTAPGATPSGTQVVADAKPDDDRVPRDWHPCAPGSTAPELYRIASDTRTAATGAASARIESLVVNPSPAAAGYCQFISAASYRGKRVAYSAHLRTRSASPGARLAIRADAADGRVVASANMRRERIPGTTDWARYTLVIDVPADADALMVGAVLMSSGTMWFDDATLEIVDESWPLTQLDHDFVRYSHPALAALPPQILNPGFETIAPRQPR